MCSPSLTNHLRKPRILEQRIIRTRKHIQRVIRIPYARIEIRDGRIQAKHGQKRRRYKLISSNPQIVHVQPTKNHEPVEHHQRRLAPRGKLVSAIEKNPLRIRHAEREPRDKQRRRDGQDGSEGRDGVCEDEGHEPEERAEGEPDGPGQRRVVGEAVPRFDHLAHDYVVHVLDPRVPEDKPRAQQRREEEAVRDFAGDAGRGAERGRHDVLAGEVVDYACYDDVHWDADGVQPDDCWGVVFAPALGVSWTARVEVGGSYGLRISHITVMNAWLPAYANATLRTDSNCWFMVAAGFGPRRISSGWLIGSPQ